MKEERTIALNLFDRLHLGHQVLIDRLSEMPNPIAGVSDGGLIGSELELAEIIQPVDLRVENLKAYLSESRLDRIDVQVFSSYDALLNIQGPVRFLMFMGPCCSEIEEHIIKSLQADSKPKVSFEFMKPVRANDGDKLSSARIRLGEIDRSGRPLVGTDEPPRRLGEELRKDLQTPKGEVFAAKDGNPEERVVEKIYHEGPPCIIAVGDVTCATLAEVNYFPDVQVIDGITKRGRYAREFKAHIEYTIYNPPATIYPEAWSAMKTAIKNKRTTLIKVEGEEDLLGFPAALLAPDDAVLLYGQPDVGIVWVPINDENRRRARAFLEAMPIITCND